MRSRTRNEYLFSNGDLRERLDEVQRTLLAEIEHVPENTMLNRPPEDLVDEFVERHRREGVVVQDEDISVSTDEVRIPIDELPEARFMFSDDEIQDVPGQQYNYHVPFSGDARLFKLRPNVWSTSTPRANVLENELVFSYPTTSERDVERIKNQFQQDLRGVREMIRNANSMVEQANAALPLRAREAIDRRRARLLTAKNTVASLGFPMRKRADQVQTFVAPKVRKKLTLQRTPSGSDRAFRPEPTLDGAEYDDILSTIQNMALVIERSPNAFRTLGEEELRTHFLMMLNGIYEGAATAETFNYGGKTDILIRVDDRNIFIAECKFWHGPAGFTATIDQLLGYTSWRDTKTSILLFNRKTATSTVVEQIPGLLSKHPNFKKSIPQAGETRFRAVMRQPSDPDRELVLTVLVFDVPRP